jgi:negative regulator of flagellin synthesis FlgM
MKVSGKDPNLNILAYVQNVRNEKNGATTGGNASDSAKRDTVSISSQGRDIRQAVAVAKSAPDVREDVVAALRARIENGTYEIDSERIAVNMIAESLLNDAE